MAVWDAFLTEDDKKVMAARKPRKPTGPGAKVGLLVIDMQNTAMGHEKPIWEQLDEYSGACGPHAWKAVPFQQKLLKAARAAGMLGKSVLGSKYAFDMEVRVGAGAYVCGEETALLDSLEGKRGQVRAKPPLPAHEGLFGKPTVINNVISLASVPIILDKGGAYYRDFGMGRSRGTIPIQITGNVKHGGLFEAAFGMTLGELVDDIGGGSWDGQVFMCTRDETFTIFGVEDCLARGYERTGFFEIDTQNRTDWTLQLTESAGAPSIVGPDLGEDLEDPAFLVDPDEPLTPDNTDTQ